MLIYHPAYDVYHCIFRMLFIINTVQELEIDKIKIIDFYLAFPSAIKDASLPRGGVKIKRNAAKTENEYHGPININRAFSDMSGVQDSAIGFLLSSNIVDKNKYKKGIICTSGAEIPNDIKNGIISFSRRYDGLYLAIVNFLSEVPLYGVQGLKHRTGLVEYRYDTV